MAAIHATLPPDLIGDESAILSDSSSSSASTNKINNNNNNKLIGNIDSNNENSTETTTTTTTPTATGCAKIQGDTLNTLTATSNHNHHHQHDSTDETPRPASNLDDSPHSNASSLSSPAAESMSPKPTPTRSSEQQLEQLDLSKKRRKQTTPLRIAEALAGAGTPVISLELSAVTTASADQQDDLRQLVEKLIENESDAEKLKLFNQKMLMEQNMDPGLDGLGLVRQAALLFNHFQKNQASKSAGSDQDIGNRTTFPAFNSSALNTGESADHQLEDGDSEDSQKSRSRTGFDSHCSDCGMKFDSKFKLKLHLMQEHGQTSGQMHSFQDQLKSSAQSMFASNKDNSNGSGTENEPTNFLMNQLQYHQQQNAAKPDDWLSLSALTFPALSASGYIPQLPLLGIPPLGQYPGASPGANNMDSLGRSNGPPLRIFNPEAYCDLCNKEFCNKYFLKTHRANKHGIYEPSTSNENSSSTTSQQQQQQQQVNPSSVSINLQQPQAIQSVATTPQPQTSPQSNSDAAMANSGNVIPTDPSAFCDICFKKFANLFAMRRHRSKAHDSMLSATTTTNPQGPPPIDKSDQQHITNNNAETGSGDAERFNAIRFPEDFRQDFSVEQEDANFTPEPRKLSPVSSQQARDANFSVDKLKRLGVSNPEAFCELCCKEYCNKYFLRTHKYKRHGILMPADDMKELIADRSNSWQYMQSSPLNLIMGGASGVDFAHMQQQLQQRFLLDMSELAHRKPLEADHNDGDSKSHDGGELPPQKAEHDVDSTKTTGSEKFVEDSETKAEITSPPAGSPTNDADTISMDLQKLQTMILQLNDLNASQMRPIPCNLCDKELENQYLFHAHLLAEHGHMNENLMKLKNISRPPSPANSAPQMAHIQHQLLGGGTLTTQSEYCKQCEKEFSTSVEFKQHLLEVHGLLQRQTSMSPSGRDGFVTPERPTGSTANGSGSGGPSMPVTPVPDRSRPPYTMTPTSSYCEICNKELCNKYFMKTHMQRMHGIEIENGSQIGGVVCNICNKELCSKYFLRVHKHNTHGIIEEGAPLPPQVLAKHQHQQQQQLQQQQNSGPQSPQEQNSLIDGIFPPLDMPMKPADLADLSSRYFSNFTEVCPMCTRRFRTAKWLRAHLMSEHGKAGIDKLQEFEQRMNLAKSNASPTLKIPNGNGGGGFGNTSITLQDTATMENKFAGLLGSSDPDELNNRHNNNINNNCAIGGAKPKEYQCSQCPFSTPYYAFLFIHERSHTLVSTNDGSTALGLHGPGSSLLSVGVLTDNLRGFQMQHSFSTRSESAVSIGKDLYPSNVNQPTTATSATNSITSTPASTPGMGPGTGGAGVGGANKQQLALSMLDMELYGDDENLTDEPTSKRKKPKLNHDLSNQMKSEQLLRKISGDAIPMAKLSKLESNNMLKDMANLTKRPAIYALPKDSEPMIMQSFLIEESARNGRSQKRKLSNAQPVEMENSRGGQQQTMNDILALVTGSHSDEVALKGRKSGSGGGGGGGSAGSGPKSVDEAARNRFVPAVVFLPVRERISTPVTISFTLTPA